MKTLIQKKILILLAGIWALFHTLISLLYYLIDVSPLYAADAVLGGAVAIYACCISLRFGRARVFVRG